MKQLITCLAIAFSMFPVVARAQTLDHISTQNFEADYICLHPPAEARVHPSADSEPVGVFEERSCGNLVYDESGFKIENGYIQLVFLGDPLWIHSTDVDFNSFNTGVYFYIFD